MTATATSWEDASRAESSLRAEMSTALEHQAQVESVAINHATGVVDVAVGLPHDLAGAELDIRYTWVRWNLENVIAHAFAVEGLRLGQVNPV